MNSINANVSTGSLQDLTASSDHDCDENVSTSADSPWVLLRPTTPSQPSCPNNNSTCDTTEPIITTLILDVDDTLYDVGTGFTAYRNGLGVQLFMMKYLNFPNVESAQLVRDEYFERYHSTVKALTMAQSEGRLPPRQSFREEDLAQYWATQLPFEMLGGPNVTLSHDLSSCSLQLVAFSNGPRQYVKRVLQELHLFHLFGEERIFAVEDTMPFCKPEKEAFEKVLTAMNVYKAEECVMIEDSMKNIRQAKKLGMKTVLVKGRTAVATGGYSASVAASEATKPWDAPLEDDPSVDVCIETVNELKSVLPGLWQTPAVFQPVKEVMR